MLQFEWKTLKYAPILALMLSEECVGIINLRMDGSNIAKSRLPGLKDKDYLATGELSAVKKVLEIETILWFQRAGIVGDWLDIESAPKDGTKILTLDLYHETDSIAVNWWFNKGKNWSNGGSNPQYWMPLPIAILPNGNPLGEHGIGFASELSPGDG